MGLNECGLLTEKFYIKMIVLLLSLKFIMSKMSGYYEPFVDL